MMKGINDMAIKTIKATIQMRRGAEQDFDPDQMTAGEWAVSTDSKKVWMCFRAGLVLRMATYEAFEQDMLEIQTILATCQDIQAAVERFKQLAEQHASQAETWSVTSKSWAIGGTGIRAGENTNNSKYWSQQSKSHSDMSKSWAIGEGNMRPDEAVNSAKYFAEQAGKIVDAAGAGGLIPAGTVTFENLPTSGMKRGWMYNISNDFTSDSRFEDGAGIKYKAGSNVYYTAVGKWDVLTGSHVTGVKGSAETNYRSGDVNITKANVGLGNVPNVTTNNQAPTFSQASARANIASGEKLSVILGKIMKWYADLKTVAFTGNYSDLSGRPAIPSVTNNLAATASGTALDAVQGKALNDKITQINSNLSELNANLQNLFVTKVITKNVTVQYLQIFSIPVPSQSGYTPIGITGFSVDYRLNLFGIGLASVNNISAILSSRDGTIITVSCSFYVLYVKNFS